MYTLSSLATKAIKETRNCRWVDCQFVRYCVVSMRRSHDLSVMNVLVQYYVHLACLP